MTNEPATKKQLWALYCITKKDYRMTNISKQDAFEIIKNAKNNNPNNPNKNSDENSNKNLMDKAYNFIKERYDNLINSLKQTYKDEFQIVDQLTNLNTKFKMYGNCSVYYMKADKRSLKAKYFIENFNTIRDKIESDLINKVGKLNQIRAVLAQDYNFNLELYRIVDQFTFKENIPVKTYIKID